MSVRVQSMLGLCLVALLALGLIALLGSMLLPGDDAVVLVEETPAPPRDPKKPQPVEIQVPLLADYYNHTIENAPPRDPVFMKRREYGNRIPRKPSDIIRPVAENEPELAGWVKTWTLGEAVTPAGLNALDGLLAKSRLGLHLLTELGRAFNYLEGDELAARFFRAALTRAGGEFASVRPETPGANGVLDELQQMGGLWRLDDYAALEKRFALAMQLQHSLNRDARRAAYLYAEILYFQGDSGNAAEAIISVADRHGRANDLSESDHYEMHWVQGCFQYFSRQYARAIPHLEACSQPQRQHTGNAQRLLIAALAKVGRVHEANAWFVRFVQENRPSAAEAGDLVGVLESVGPSYTPATR